MLAAATLHAARAVVEERAPAGLDCRFLRPLPAGRAQASTTVLHRGRRLSCVRVDLLDEQGRLATTATASFIDPDQLHALDVDAGAAPTPARLRRWSILPGVDIPIVGLLAPQLGTVGPGTIAAEVTLPWDDPGAGAAESACVAADLCVGPPVAAACEGTWSPHPNPDLSLRFAPGDAPGPSVTGIGRLVCMAAGQAVVGIEVHAAGHRLAAGAATSMLLPPDRR